MRIAIVLAAWMVIVAPAARAADEAPNARALSAQRAALGRLAADFFEWRRSQQPASGDDIPRVERPDGWVPDYSPDALTAQRARYQAFLQAAEAFETADWPVQMQVDLRLLKAAIARVYWELEVLKSPQRNPLFYVDQTLGSVYELLILSSPMSAERARNLILRLGNFPAMVKAAEANLDDPVRPFAETAITRLEGIEKRLQTMHDALRPQIPEEQLSAFDKSVATASRALRRYSRWLGKRLDRMQTAFAIGPEAYQWFLANVALLPYTPDELLEQGRQAWARAVSWDVLERNRNRGLPALPLFRSVEHQIRATELKEKEIRSFLETQGLMSIPDWLQHYRNQQMPAYLTPLAFMGVADDLTSETRLGEDAVRYIPPPAPDLPFFQLSAAKDPRPLLIHEGIPGHYFQLAQSWANPDPIRRRYIDSSANEGIAFYVEELLLQAGLFDFSPRSREIIYSYMRLRALRVEVDIRLAVGNFTIEQAADYLARTVPLDRATALDEAVHFAFGPGQAISYQIGKLQILRFLADAKLNQGEDFSLRDFHDFLMRNGNVPIALQRWEYLGRDDAVLRLDALGAQAVTVPR